MSASDFRIELGNTGTVSSYNGAMKPGYGRGLVTDALGISVGNDMPSRRAFTIGRSAQDGLTPETRVLVGRGGEVAVSYVGNQPAAVASMALKGMLPNVASVENGLRA